jgi:hypothetical protein
LANGGRNISRSLKLLCLKRNIGNLSAIQKKSGYLLRQRGNERLVGYSDVIFGAFLRRAMEGITCDIQRKAKTASTPIMRKGSM